MSTVFEKKNNSTQNDSDCDSNVSQSDLDCSGLLNLSNQDITSKLSGNDSAKNTEVGSPVQASTSNADLSVQSAINQQILDQLQSIGRRLDQLEQNSVKKSLDLKKIKKNKPKTNQDTVINEHTEMLVVPQKITSGSVDQSVPSLASLRQDMQIQQQVQQRLAEFAQQQITGTDNKVKSLRGGPDVFVKNRVKWPHDYVLCGSTKEMVTYDQLTTVQWVSGFCCTMQDEKNKR